MNFLFKTAHKQAQSPSHVPVETRKAPPSPKVLRAHEKIAPAILERTDLSAVVEIPRPVLMEQVDFLAGQFLKKFKLGLSAREREELIALLAADIAAAAGLIPAPQAYA